MGAYKVIGLMSGTSLDGLDIAYCEFSEKNKKWGFTIKNAETVKYNSVWKKRLSEVENKKAIDFAEIHIEFGHFTGQLTKKFISKNGIKADFISSHGHTIFHQPKKKLSFQIGSGAAISAETNLPVVCDFRSMDIAMGGQGAPLVPIGDELLFSQYDYCLNLGGFSNISFKHNKQRIAFDICPVNIVINHLCHALGKDFDDKGNIARKGKVNEKLLAELNKINYYHLPKNKSKSLGKEWMINTFYPVLNKHKLPVQDKLRTVYEHISEQINLSTLHNKRATLLASGGGVYNSFLMERISSLTNHKIIVPDKKTIEFKEALIFAFLGVLRMRNEVNSLKSVTGALKDNIGGTVYWNK